MASADCLALFQPQIVGKTPSSLTRSMTHEEFPFQGLRGPPGLSVSCLASSEFSTVLFDGCFSVRINNSTDAFECKSI